MTIVRGVQIFASPCCGAQYAFPRYVSMNFSAFEYWTDGWREWSLMPNDEGLRRCKCGQFVVIKDMVPVEKTEASDAGEDGPNDRFCRVGGQAARWSSVANATEPNEEYCLARRL